MGVFWEDSSDHQGAGVTYQVMTLSAMGDAETPAGGSVCMRYIMIDFSMDNALLIKPLLLVATRRAARSSMWWRAYVPAYLEVSHEPAAS